MADDEETSKHTFKPGDKVGWGDTFRYVELGCRAVHGSGPFTINSVRSADDARAKHHQFVKLEELHGEFTGAWFIPALA